MELTKAHAIAEENLIIHRAFNMESGQYVMSIKFIGSSGRELATISFSHEAYHKVTRFIAEHDDRVYNHSRE